MKLILSVILTCLSSVAIATIKSSSEGHITKLITYDDHLGGTAYIYFSPSISACPSGMYLNPSSPGFERLYSASLAAFLSNRKVVFQIYDDRIQDTRCEVDAIQILSN